MRIGPHQVCCVGWRLQEMRKPCYIGGMPAKRTQMPIKTVDFKVVDQGRRPQIVVEPLERLLALKNIALDNLHRTRFYHVFIFEDCAPTHLVDFSPIDVAPYSLLFISAEMVHQFDPLRLYKGDVIIFTEEFFCLRESDCRYLRRTPVFHGAGGSPLLRLDKTRLQPFQALAQAIRKECQENVDNIQHEFLKNILHNFLLLAERETQKLFRNEGGVVPAPDQELTMTFREMLEMRFRALKNVNAYCKALGVTEKKLAGATSRALGKSPKECIDARVVLEAKRLLCHDCQSIKSIAFDLGFEEATNFAKFFRKHTGSTPLDFRNGFLRGRQEA